MALITFNRDAGDTVAALGYAERLERLSTNDQEIGRLIADLRSRLGR
jgi:hypothetical protein